MNDKIWALLEEIPDPEIPVLSIVDLGIIRDVQVSDAQPPAVVVTITPTYSGCPAMRSIEDSILAQLQSNFYPDSTVKTVLSPAWTTDWLSEKGRTALKAYGIAPPDKESTSKRSLLGHPLSVECPQCHSTNSQIINEFGSTPCKALYRCLDCKEPFDYFKCH